MRLSSPEAEVMRLSSNVIKGVMAYINQEDVRTIDSNRSMKFRPLSAISEREYLAESEDLRVDAGGMGFSGITEDDLEELDPNEFLLREREGFMEEAQGIIDGAKEEAEKILSDARNQAEFMKMNALSEGKEQGYKEGLQNAREEIERIKSDLESKSKEMDLKYEQARKNLEPEMAEVLIGLVKNVTGVILENDDSVILHLVARAMGRIARNDQFILHVSKQDYVVLEKRKQFLEKLAGQNKKIMLVEEEDMVKGQCRIETDDQIVDCGVDTQMGNLFENILLLAKV